MDFFENFRFIFVGPEQFRCSESRHRQIARDEFRFLSTKNGQKEIEHVGVEHKNESA